jgi:hypothetical protein
MGSRILAVLISVFLISTLFVVSASAGWVTNGVPICTETKYQGDARIISDGAGGAIITWYDSRGYNNDIYAQRIDAWGNVLWTGNGADVCTWSASQSYPEVVPDGAGGAIICWMDPRTPATGWDIYVQRINSSGNLMWDPVGVSVCTVDFMQGQPEVASDGAGGAIMVWYDQRDGDRDLYAGRVDAGGSSLWGGGILICTVHPANQTGYRIISDGAGGAIITWSDDRVDTESDIFAQRIDASGDTLWTRDGIAVCDVDGTQLNPQIIPDGAGGAIITWEDFRGIFAQRIDADGIGLWTAGGDTVCAAPSSQQHPQIAADGYGGAVITWEDNRDGGSTGLDIYAQRIDSGCNRQWGVTGQAVCTSSGAQDSPYITSDGSGGAVVTWVHTIDLYDSNIYARVIDAGGTPQGIASGVALCAATGIQYIPRIATDGAGGAIVCWTDSRSGTDADVYSARICFTGATGVETPEAHRSGYLTQNFPNPFNPSTTVRFSLPQVQFVNLAVYSVDGRLIATLVNESRPAGPHEIEWDGRDDLGREVSSGVYFYRLETGSIKESKRMVLIK